MTEHVYDLFRFDGGHIIARLLVGRLVSQEEQCRQLRQKHVLAPRTMTHIAYMPCASASSTRRAGRASW